MASAHQGTNATNKICREAGLAAGLSGRMDYRVQKRFVGVTTSELTLMPGDRYNLGVPKAVQNEKKIF